MAYDASNSSGTPQQFVGSNPLSSSSEITQASQGLPSSVNPSTENTPQVVPQSSSGSSGRPKKATSGMFTNIQRYVDANRPQAQNIASAATTNVQKEASQIGNAIKQKQESQDKKIQSNQNIINEQKDFAQNTINNALSGSNLNENDINRFQTLKEKGANISNVSSIDIGSQQNQAENLQNIAKNIETEGGRKELLKNTFGNREYTRGQSSLDDLILSGDKDARGNLIGNTKNISNELNQNVKNVIQETESNRQNLLNSANNLKTDIANLGINAETGLEEELDTKYNQFKENRKLLLEDQIAQLTRQNTQGASDNVDQILNNLNNFDSERLLDTTGIRPQLISQGWKSINDPNKIDSNEYVNNKAIEISKNLSSALGINIGEQALNDIKNSIQSNLITVEEKDPNFKGSGYFTGNLGETGINFRNTVDSSGLKESLSNILSKYKNENTIRDTLLSDLQNKTGLNYDQLLSSEGTNKYNVASMEDSNRYNNLKKLLGRENTIDTVKQGSALNNADLETLLKNYSLSNLRNTQYTG